MLASSRSDQGLLQAAGCGQQAGAGCHQAGQEEWREAGLPGLSCAHFAEVPAVLVTGGASNGASCRWLGA
jgi:hypothetical protein